jgi:hypothetical protein
MQQSGPLPDRRVPVIYTGSPLPPTLQIGFPGTRLVFKSKIISSDCHIEIKI